ncbi:DUF2333 family protein [Halomonas stenophila]|uniref:DUF2333 domain-containing protein n=1 Tax=Halomonas stenophila TaxID=795312 RepID=A0A7W5ESE7_9GAMM|nr:DUF2333 family protein [Halomonas stenophila]MBB3229490.1 hypothetical protein [Halomonas stenophila]
MALTRKAADRRRNKVEALERPQYGWIWKPLLAVLVIYLLVALGLGIWWSRTPPPFALEPAVAEQREATTAARGAVTTAGLRAVIETLLDKPGGYLRNDLAPPGLWLDNLPAWELGVLNQGRRLSRALPAMARGEAGELERVEAQLQGDSRDWFYPSTEHRLEQASSGLGAYLERLGGDGEVAFAGGGRGLAPWLADVATGLDDLGSRLSASVARPAALADLDIEAEGLPRETPWYRVDNVFFEARGQAWALLHLLEAVRHDQADVLAAAGLAGRWEMLVAELERSQRRLWSPVVLNGSGFGVFANHSLVMANHVVRARDLSRELARTLEQAVPVTVPGAADEAAEDAGSPTQPPAESDAPVAEGEAASADQAAEDAGSPTQPPAESDAPVAEGEAASADQAAEDAGSPTQPPADSDEPVAEGEAAH